MTTGTPPRRSRVRRFLPLGIAAWAVLEVWLLMLVAGAAGGFTVFLVLVAGLVLGAVVIKAAGRRAFQNLSETIQRAQTNPAAAPAEPRTQGNGLLMLAGLLLMIPGLITDALGLLLLVPPVRGALSRYTERAVERRMSTAAEGTLGGAFQQARMRQPGTTVIQGEVVREDDRPGSHPDDSEPRPPIMPS
ncbi:FxsA family membrane protein [Streptomyces sp. NPDC059524]|uniref:FxsA family membrane protein n=1 Tax=Streptomyces sp. NPDC059524 TaxID=3346856 RepID=UPI0036C0C980